MTDAAIAAPEAASISAPPPSSPPVTAPTEAVTQDAPNPVKSEPPAKVEIVEAKKPSIKDSIKAAEAKVNRNEGDRIKREEAKTTKPVEVKTEAPKPVETAVKAEPWREAPKRFNEAEKAEWEKAPDNIKQGVHRAVKELEEGHTKYKQAATEYEALKPFKDMADAAKVSLPEALKNYTDLDNALRSGTPQQRLAAIETVLNVAKVSPQDYAAFISNQPVDQAASQNNHVIRQLQEQVQSLTQRLNGVAETTETQQTEQAKAQLNEWAKDKPHALRLADQIAVHFNSGLDLDEAYATAVSDAEELAASMGFTLPSAPPQNNVTELAAHTPKTQKSIAGAPGPGSYLATEKRSDSVKEAVLRAMRNAG